MAYSVTIDQSAILDGANADAADVTTPFGNTKTAIEDLGNGVSGPEQLRLVEIATPSNPAASSVKIYVNSTDHKLHKLTSAGTDSSIEYVAPTVYPNTPQGRLTLTSGLPVTTSDVTAATTIYYTPYGGNKVTLYNLTTWVEYGLTELSYSLAGLAASLPRDIFLHYSGSALELLPVGWTNTTTRATSLTTQDGVLVLSSDKTYRYLGTITTTSTIGQTEDSALNRLVFNYYNRMPRTLQVTESTDTWTYSTATWRPWNNSTSNRVTFTQGVAESAVSIRIHAAAISATSAVGLVAFGLDSTTAPTGVYSETKNATNSAITAEYVGVPAAGSHYLQVLEYASAATMTFLGDNSAGVAMQGGAIGTVMA